jgi:8-oxo-dGTP pyrophosphatase MutT (NUDIX family)
MKCKYREILKVEGEMIEGEKKSVILPFKRISARAIIVRSSDGALLGTLHRRGGSHALPGGSMENGETSLETIQRELEEENIHLINPDPVMQDSFTVDYFSGYGELSVWHFFVVEEADIGETDENIATRWVTQDEDVWYPGMREKVLIELENRLPHLAKKSVLVQ